VDPLALGDLSPLAGLFSDPDIEKVFHAAEYDLIGLKRDFKFEFANLFDTMVAARILGREQVGLGSMLEAEFDVHLDKRHQRANWGQRPLPAHLLNYARQDTHYLIPLRQRLEAALRERGQLSLAKEDFERLAAARNAEKPGSENGKASGESHTQNGQQANCWRVSGSYDLEPQRAAVLHELCCYRERVARSANLPLFKVISDQTLLAIAAQAPRNLHELGRVKGMSVRQVQRHGHALLNAVERGLKAEPLYPPRSRRPDRHFLERLEVLRTWRKEAAERLGVPSDVVLPRDLMTALAEIDPQNQAELAHVLSEAPWRLENFGEEILGAMHNHHD
jgi:ribonuclease D